MGEGGPLPEKYVEPETTSYVPQDNPNSWLLDECAREQYGSRISIEMG